MDREMTQEQREAYEKKLGMYYDAQGRLKQYPSKRPLREIALSKIAAHFEKDRIYTEKEVNEIIRQSISFSDVELIRREMFEKKLIGCSGNQLITDIIFIFKIEIKSTFRNACFFYDITDRRFFNSLI